MSWFDSPPLIEMEMRPARKLYPLSWEEQYRLFRELPGHKSERFTTHYSAPDIARLFEAAEKVCERRPNTDLRVAAHTILPQSVTQDGSSRVDHMQVVDVYGIVGRGEKI